MRVLESIVARKREEVSRRKRQLPMSVLREQAPFRGKTLSLTKALLAKDDVGIIAEIKRSSPSAGSLNDRLRPANVARQYEWNGATAISVLTDNSFFGGSLEDLREVRAAVQLPVLMKEFIFDPYQIGEARAYGADAILLIAAILERSQLQDLFSAATEARLECLVEVHNERDMHKIDFNICQLIGINNRNLDTLAVNLATTVEMAPLIPRTVTLVSESGVSTAKEIRLYRAAGVHGVLIGEHFMKADRPWTALRTLLNELHR